MTTQIGAPYRPHAGIWTPLGTVSSAPAGGGSGGAPTFDGNFDNGTFHNWANSDQGSNQATMMVETNTTAGITTPPSGKTELGHFECTAANLAAGRTMAKLYMNFDIGAGVNFGDAVYGGGQLPLVTNKMGGVYSSWYYVPSGYVMGSSGLVNLMQIKENYSTNGINLNGSAGVDWGSDMQSGMHFFTAGLLNGFYGPSNWQQVGSAPPASNPYLAVNLWHNPAVALAGGHKYQAIACPVDQWFQIKATVVPDTTTAGTPNSSITWQVLNSGGTALMTDTFTGAEYPGIGVRRNGTVPSYSGQAGGQTCIMTYGIGHYGNNVGKLWTCDASWAAS